MSTRQVEVGLCRTCAHAREVPTAQAVYWLCRLAETDPRFERYPRLPVIACEGYEPAPPRAPAAERVE